LQLQPTCPPRGVTSALVAGWNVAVLQRREERTQRRSGSRAASVRAEPVCPLLYAPLVPSLSSIRRHWDWIGLAAGVAMGFADYGLFVFMGSPELSPPDPAVFAIGLAVVFGALGFAVGRLALARHRARRDTDTIER
jgi:hypothetical protein